MIRSITRRTFLQAGVGAGVLVAGGARVGGADDTAGPGQLTVNDDGYVFLLTSDDLTVDDLRRYLQSYCRDGVDSVAYCVGDMSWPAHYPTKVGQPYTDAARQPSNLKRWRIAKNVDRFASEPGGYFGAVFRILRELGKTTYASFRMNDAHFTSPDDPNVSDFWKAHADKTVGKEFGYYGGGLNYAHEVVRQHFIDRVLEFAELYPDIDGIELDAMRSPYFFPPDQEASMAPVFTELIRTIKAGLAAQARRLGRSDYLLRTNVPMSPELALTSGLDVATWDREGLFDSISVGTYQACMNVPFGEWKALLSNGTPVLAYTNISAQDGQALATLEYRAAASNAYGAGADGIYLFNYPCLFEYGFQNPIPIDHVDMTLPDLRERGHSDYRKIGDVLDEIHDPAKLAGKNKRFLYYFNNNAGYRHFPPVLPWLNRNTPEQVVRAELNYYEDDAAADHIRLRFKIEQVLRSERFTITLNGQELVPEGSGFRYASYGRDTRTHTIPLEPYQEYEFPLQPGELRRGRNLLEVKALQVDPDLFAKIHVKEIEVLVGYPG